MYLECREHIKQLKRTAGLCFLEIGRYCAIIEDNELWKFEDGIASFETWIHDPDFGPGIGRRSVYNFMKLYRLATYLLEKYAIDTELFAGIGIKKLNYLAPYLEKAVADDKPKDEIENMLHHAYRVPYADLEETISDTKKIRFYASAYVGSDENVGVSVLILKPDAILGGELAELDGKTFFCSLRESRRKRGSAKPSDD